MTYPVRSTLSRRALATAFMTFAAFVGSTLVTACGSDSTGPSSRPSAISDRANDFIPSFTGTKGADLDVRDGESSYTGSGYVFSGTMNAKLGTTPGAVYVWGVDRGAGTPRFGDIATGVHFDAVVIGFPDGTGSVRDFVSGVATPLAAGSVVVTDRTMRVTVPAALLPTRGFSAANYTVAFWPRTGLASNDQIADFAPDNGNAPLRMAQ